MRLVNGSENPSRLTWNPVGCASVGLGFALLTMAWHPFSPFSMGVWLKNVTPLLLGGQAIMFSSNRTLASLALPILAGAVYGIPFTVLMPKGSPKPKRHLVARYLPVVAAVVTGLTAGLAGLGEVGSRIDAWDAANIGMTVVLGIVLALAAQLAGKSRPTSTRAVKLAMVLTCCAGLAIASYFLLPLGLLLLAVSYFSLPFAYGSEAREETESV